MYHVYDSLTQQWLGNCGDGSRGVWWTGDRVYSHSFQDTAAAVSFIQQLAARKALTVLAPPDPPDRYMVVDVCCATPKSPGTADVAAMLSVLKEFVDDFEAAGGADTERGVA